MNIELRTIESINKLFKLIWEYSEIAKYKYSKYNYNRYHSSEEFIIVSNFVGKLNKTIDSLKERLKELLAYNFKYNKSFIQMFNFDIFISSNNICIDKIYIKLQQMLKTIDVLILTYKQFKHIT